MHESLSLLRRAAAIYDDPRSPLAGAAAQARDFATGARWMHTAFSTLRGTSLPPMRGGFQRAGVLKYLAASLVALLPVVAALLTSQWLLLPLAIPCFYAVEVQFLFLFPLMLDHHPRPLAQSLRLTQRAGGTLRAVATVLPIAAFMLFGVLFGQGVRRSWCLGCLAVCLWYEQVRHCLPHIRHETFSAFQLQTPVTLLFASDLHLGLPWSRRVCVQLLQTIRHTRPDLILLGGDLLDARRALAALRRTLARMASRCPIYLTPGNHDERFPQLQTIALDAGIHWLPLAPVLFHTKSGETLTITRAAIANGPRRQIVCTHDPASLRNASPPLAFAGHLHGGQCVLATHRGKLFPGYLFNRRTALHIITAASTQFISRGLADTLPLRWNCPHEVILCRIS